MAASRGSWSLPRRHTPSPSSSEPAPLSGLLVETSRSRSGPDLTAHDPLLVETGFYRSDTDLTDSGLEPSPAGEAAPAASASASVRTRTYSLTRLYYTVSLEPAAGEGETLLAEPPATLPRRAAPIAVIGEETHLEQQGRTLVLDVSVEKKKKKKKFKRFLSLDSLRKGVHRGRERLQSMDVSLRKQARNTLRKIKTEKPGKPGDKAVPTSTQQNTVSETIVEKLYRQGPRSPLPPPASTVTSETISEVIRRPLTVAPQSPPSQSHDMEESQSGGSEPRASPIPPELSLGHELELAEAAASRAGRADGADTGAVRGDIPWKGSGGGGVDDIVKREMSDSWATREHPVMHGPCNSASRRSAAELRQRSVGGVEAAANGATPSDAAMASGGKSDSPPPQREEGSSGQENGQPEPANKATEDGETSPSQEFYGNGGEVSAKSSSVPFQPRGLACVVWFGSVLTCAVNMQPHGFDGCGGLKVRVS